MSLKLYFANLISTTGAEGFVLEVDNASSCSSDSASCHRTVDAGASSCCPERRQRRSSQDHHLNDDASDGTSRASVVRKPQQQQLQPNNVNMLADLYNEALPLGIGAIKDPQHNTAIRRSCDISQVLRSTTNMEAYSQRASKKCFHEYLDAVQDIVCRPNSATACNSVDVVPGTDVSHNNRRTRQRWNGSLAA